ncbi:MAG: hypothetical protein J6T74_00595 [Clostridia bacterium]|nr:hypothetical protein [Clostridia bacterium]
MEDSKQVIVDSAKQYATYLIKNISQTDENGNVMYYFSGSLAMLLLSSAQSIKICLLDNGGKTVKEKPAAEFSQKAKESLSKGVRSVGADIDIVTINEDAFNGKGGVYNLSAVKNNCDLSLYLCPAWKNINGTMYFDCLTDEREIVGHSTAEITFNDGNKVIIADPMSLIMHKFADTLTCYATIQKFKDNNTSTAERIAKLVAKYKKDISDFVSMFNGCISIYSQQKFEKYIEQTLKMCPQTAFSRILSSSKLSENIEYFYNDAKEYIEDKNLFESFINAMVNQNEQIVDYCRDCC